MDRLRAMEVFVVITDRKECNALHGNILLKAELAVGGYDDSCLGAPSRGNDNNPAFSAKIGPAAPLETIRIGSPISRARMSGEGADRLGWISGKGSPQVRSPGPQIILAEIAGLLALPPGTQA